MAIYALKISENDAGARFAGTISVCEATRMNYLAAWEARNGWLSHVFRSSFSFSVHPDVEGPAASSEVVQTSKILA